MKRTLVITDLTQMPRGNEVCVVGIDETGNCIRPCCDGGFLKDYLYDADGRLVIRHGAKVEFELYPIIYQAPHVEDMGFNSDSITSKGLCTGTEWEQVLQNSSFNTVDDIYDGLLQEHRWVEPGANTRSIGTLSKVRVTSAKLPEWEGKLKYRLYFIDSTGFPYDNISVSDLAFRELSYAEVKKHGRSPATVSEQITSLLTSTGRIYLRLGLARPWVNPNTGNIGCWMQVTGIYTFPDYLGGKSFADF